MVLLQGVFVENMITVLFGNLSICECYRRTVISAFKIFSLFHVLDEGNNLDN